MTSNEHVQNDILNNELIDIGQVIEILEGAKLSVDEGTAESHIFLVTKKRIRTEL